MRHLHENLERALQQSKIAADSARLGTSDIHQMAVSLRELDCWLRVAEKESARALRTFEDAR